MLTQKDFDGQNLEQSLVLLRQHLPPDCLEVNLGCGQRTMAGMLNVDESAPDADVRCDLFRKRLFKQQYKWPFKTGSIDLAYSQHFLEHVPDWNAFWREMDRVVAPGGFVVSTMPYYASVRAFQDPDHKQALSSERFDYLSREWRENGQLGHYGFAGDFRKVALLFEFHPDFRDKAPSVVAYAMTHYINVVQNFAVILQKPA